LRSRGGHLTVRPFPILTLLSLFSIHCAQHFSPLFLSSRHDPALISALSRSFRASGRAPYQWCVMECGSGSDTSSERNDLLSAGASTDDNDTRYQPRDGRGPASSYIRYLPQRVSIEHASRPRCDYFSSASPNPPLRRALWYTLLLGLCYYLVRLLVMSPVFLLLFQALVFGFSAPSPSPACLHG